jgi:hypothetical protein
VNALQKLRARVRTVRGVRWLRHWLRLVRTLRPRLRRQLAFGPPQTRTNARRIFIPLIETAHYQSYQILLIARLLQQRGHTVKVLLCDSLLAGCEVKSVRMTQSDPCLNCRFMRTRSAPLFGLDIAVLGDYVSAERAGQLRVEAARVVADFPKRFEYLGVDLIPLVNDSVTRYYYGAVPEEGDHDLRERRAQHLASAMLTTEVARGVHETFQPDIVFSHMDVYCEWAPYHRYLKARGARSSTISISPFNFHALLLNYVELYSPRRYQRWLAQRQERGLDEAERGELAAFVDQRFAGLSQIFTENAYFEANASIAAMLRIDPEKRNVFVFSNVFWDVGMSELGVLFTDVIDWVCETIAMLADDPRCPVYVKTHPAEEFDSSSSLKGVWHHVRERFPQLPANVTHIAPGMKIRPYDLFPHIDVGVVYGGTIGIEMMLRGIPVVLAAAAPYGGLGLVEEPKSREQYRELLIGEAQPKLADREAAAMFAYFYFIKSLIPWNLTRRAYADTFEGFAYDTAADVEAGKNPHLDHLLESLVDPEKSPEAW